MVTTRGGGVTGPGIVAQVKSKIPGTKEHRALKGTGGIKKHVPGTAEHNITHPGGATTGGVGPGPTTGGAMANAKAHVPGTTEHKMATAGRPRAKAGIMTKIKKAIPGTVEHKAAHPTVGATTTGPGI